MNGTGERAASGLGGALRTISAATAALVFVQAALAGQWLAGHAQIIVTHGWIGNLAYLGALALVVIGVLLWRRGHGAGMAGLTLLLALLMTAQLGLGYVGRQQAWAAGVHIPGGVLISGLLVWIMANAWLRPAGRRG
ncbi:MAG: hypothetical protein ACKOWF_08990 [Chloroflexota bacterium]